MAGLTQIVMSRFDMPEKKMEEGEVDLNYKRSHSSVESLRHLGTIDHDGSVNHLYSTPGIVPIGKSPKPRMMAKILRSVINAFQHPLPCKWLSMPGGPSRIPTLGTRVTGTLYGYRNKHASFAVHESPRSQPLFQIELAMPTNSLVKEMSSGLLRIALECEKTSLSKVKLFQEPVWTMYCNGRKAGYAMNKNCSETDMRVLGMVQAITMGAGVLPPDNESPDGEIMYMRARFDRVVCSKDSEAFYMMNPDGTGGPDLSIFLLRI